MAIMFSNEDFRGRVDESLSAEVAWNIGKAFADWLPEEGAVAVVEAAGAHRPTTHAVIEGLLLQGRDVVAHSGGDQTVVANTVADGKAVGGVFVSHNDLQNIEIIALYDGQGIIVTSDRGLGEISAMVEAGNFVPAVEKGATSTLS